MMIEMVATSSFAKELDERLLEVRCPKCKRLLSVTCYEVRCGRAVPCPNCESWVPLWDAEGLLQSLYDMAVSVDRAMEIP
jgi:hypothetical protein